MSAIGVCQSAERDLIFKNDIRAKCEINGLHRECRVFQLNEKGLFIESFVPAITGSKVAIHLNLPNGHQVSTQAVVTHHQFKEGFKVNFINLSAIDGEQINNCVRT
jgi:hypothetical protein